MSPNVPGKTGECNDVPQHSCGFQGTLSILRKNHYGPEAHLGRFHGSLRSFRGQPQPSAARFFALRKCHMCPEHHLGCFLSSSRIARVPQKTPALSLHNTSQVQSSPNKTWLVNPHNILLCTSYQPTFIVAVKASTPKQ
jgi:hypothetical protein